MTDIDVLNDDYEPLNIDRIRAKNVRGLGLSNAEYKMLMDYFDMQDKLKLQQNKSDLRDRNELNKHVYRLISNNLDRGIQRLFS